MSDSEDEKGSVGSEDDSPGFDPTQLDKMPEKERKKWEKNLEKWRVFVDFLVRHVAIATFRYNCFEKEELVLFMMAMEKAEVLRLNTKLKKGEEPRISSFKTMKESTELLMQHQYLAEANRIRKFLDLAGRMKGIGMIAGGFYKALKKGKVVGLEKLQHYLDYWKGFCVRSYDYSELQFRGTDPERFNELERKYMVWPTVVRTSINLAQKFLKRASDSTGLALISPDPKALQKHMQAVEFVVAAKIEDMLFQKVLHETNTFSLGSSLLQPAETQTTGMDFTSKDGKKWDIDLDDIHPDMIKPIPDTGMLLNLPQDPPKEKKGKKKGKGKGKGKSGRGISASSHKGKKKKKK